MGSSSSTQWIKQNRGFRNQNETKKFLIALKWVLKQTQQLLAESRRANLESTGFLNPMLNAKRKADICRNSFLTFEFVETETKSYRIVQTGSNYICVLA